MLAVSMSKGEGFWLLQDGSPDERWVLKEVFLSRGFILEGPDGHTVSVGESEETNDDEIEIVDDVWVSDGHRHIVGRARVVFNAPQSITILRDELYVERKKQEAAHVA